MDHRFQSTWEDDPHRCHVAVTEKGNCGGRAIENWEAEGDFDELENGAVPCAASSGPVFDQSQLDEDGQYRPKSNFQKSMEGKRVGRNRRNHSSPKVRRDKSSQRWRKTRGKAQATRADRGPPDPQVRTDTFQDRCRYSPSLLEQDWEQEPLACRVPQWYESQSRTLCHSCTWCRN